MTKPANDTAPIVNKTIDMGNNESVSEGVFPHGDRFLAMTTVSSKWFQTRKGAERWYARATAY